MPELMLRDATLDDAEVIAGIYRPYVLTSAATMESDPPAETEMRRRIEDVRALGLPYLLAEVEGEVVGYGYASPFRPRVGYRYTVENTLYLTADRTGRGYGRQVMQALVTRCREYGARQMIAVIGGENPASVAMHRALGFDVVGILKDAGWKFDRAHNITMMQLAL